MATPIKQNVCAIVPDKTKCVSCSCDSKLRYYILKANGEQGPSFEAACTFYQASFQCDENKGCVKRVTGWWIVF